MSSSRARLMHDPTTATASYFGAERECVGFLGAVAVPDETDDRGAAGEELDLLDVKRLPLPVWARIGPCCRCTRAVVDVGSVATVCAEARRFELPVDAVLGLEVPHPARATVSASPTLTVTARKYALPRWWRSVSHI